MRKLLLTAIALALAVPALAAQQDIAQISAVTASREALRTAVNTQLSAVQSNFDEVYAVIDAGPVYVNASAPADTKVVWIDTDQSNAIKVYIGGAWTVVGSGGEGSYTLPTAAADTLGGVKVGDRLTITDGVLSADVQTGDGSATYPSAAGVANWGGSAWGTSYTVGTGASNLVQLNASAQLPAVSGSLLTGSFTGTLIGTQTTLSGAIQTIGTELDGQDELIFGSEFTETAGPGTVTVTLDTDLITAAGGDSAGNLKLFGTNSSGTVGWYDIPGAGSGIAHATADGKWYGSKDGAWVDLAPTFSSALPKWIDLVVGHNFTTGDLSWYNGQVWKASTTHVKATGEYPSESSDDWEPFTVSGGSYPEGYMEIDGGDSTSTTFAGVIDGGASI